MSDKIKLYGFNNLTKTLCFNIYDVCYAKEKKEQEAYVRYIDEQYNSTRLTKILCEVVNLIGAHVLSISKQDYDPQGASVTILISEEKLDEKLLDDSCNGGNGVIKDGDKCVVRAGCVLAHLDTSHVTVHTYPEYHPDNCIATFRVDIDVSTCGQISPLDILNYLIKSFDSDVITIDYRVRGFTRNTDGKKCFIDHEIKSVQDYINNDILKQYDVVDLNVYQSNTFHTKMLIKEINLQNYLFRKKTDEFIPQERLEITNNLRKEMIEIFNGTNIYT